MRIKYNAPAVLTFTLVSVLALALTKFYLPDLIGTWFTVPGKEKFSPSSLNNWVSLFSHIIGHSGWNHLINNFMLILLLGPMLEENYGSGILLFMIGVTAIVTGVLNIFLFSPPLLGASGIVFMMILLASFTNITRGEIPLTFILVLALYLGDQIIRSSNANNISYFAHIAGGFCGSLFGFFFRTRRSR